MGAQFFHLALLQFLFILSEFPLLSLDLLLDRLHFGLVLGLQLFDLIIQGIFQLISNRSSEILP